MVVIKGNETINIPTRGKLSLFHCVYVIFNPNANSLMVVIKGDETINIPTRGNDCFE